MLEWFRSRGGLVNFKDKSVETEPFLPFLPQKRLFSTSKGLYLGAVTVTKAGRNTRSAMR